MEISNYAIPAPLEIKADPLESSFDAELIDEETEQDDKHGNQQHGKAIAELRTDVDGLKVQMTKISQASARPVLAGSGEGVKGMRSSVAARDFVSKYLRRGDHAGVELKSFSGASGPEGGFAVPREIDALIGRTLKNISPIRSIATVVQTGSAGYRKLVTNGGTPSGWVSETAGRPETDTPNFNEIAPPGGELYANPAASQSMLDDAAFDVEAWLLAGANIAAIGREIVQFGSAVPIGDRRYVLSGFLRGLAGTEAEMDGHVAGENFVLLKGGDLTEIDARHYTPFQPVTLSALGRGDALPVARSINAPGRAMKPWSPVHSRARLLLKGDLEIGWTRRSRAGLLWPEYVEMPLAAESE